MKINIVACYKFEFDTLRLVNKFEYEGRTYKLDETICSYDEEEYKSIEEYLYHVESIIDDKNYIIARSNDMVVEWFEGIKHLLTTRKQRGKILNKIKKTGTINISVEVDYDDK